MYRKSVIPTYIPGHQHAIDEHVFLRGYTSVHPVRARARACLYACVFVCVRVRVCCCVRVRRTYVCACAREIVFGRQSRT